MTFFSLWILHDRDLSADPRCSTARSVVQDLEFAAVRGRYGPWQLVRWAEPRGLPTYWRNGVWVYVRASGQEVLEFFTQQLPGERPSQAIQPGERYMIESDEF
jgi:hypothetical protein